jgi:nucleoside phosphorylase
MGVKSADILLVTVTKVEGRAVLDVFAEATRQRATPVEIDGRTYFALGSINGAPVFMTQSEMGAAGLGASLLTVQKGIEALSPGAIIMVGIAFGVDESTQEIGDILVAENLRPYDLQRIGSKIILRTDRPHTSSRLLNRMKSADLLGWEGTHVRFGVVLTGEKLVDNVDFREQLRGFEPEAIGGEMEGGGLYVAAHDKKIDWILVKSICDWADGNKAQDRTNRQQIAATNAAKFVLHSLQLTPYQREGTPSRSLTIETGGLSSLPTQPFFFGRDNELAKIAEAILPESRTWGALIDGPGGIGKTALAVRAGHLAPVDDYPRKIFLSAKVRELTPAGEQKLEDFMLPSYLALLSELAQQLGNTDLAKMAEHERPNAVRLALTGQRALIIIDNVETFPEGELVRLYQFLGRLPPGCKAIVTSRRRSDVDARVIRLTGSRKRMHLIS